MFNLERLFTSLTGRSIQHPTFGVKTTKRSSFQSWFEIRIFFFAIRQLYTSFLSRVNAKLLSETRELIFFSPCQWYSIFEKVRSYGHVIFSRFYFQPSFFRVLGSIWKCLSWNCKNSAKHSCQMKKNYWKLQCP